MDYTVVKAAMRSIGQAVTDGPDWSASDSSLFRDFAQFTLGVNYADAAGLLQFPENFPTEWAKINELADVDPVALTASVAPVETPEVPEPEATSVEPEIEPETIPVESANPVVVPVADEQLEQDTSTEQSNEE